jgi:hypothetical protein
VPDSHPDGATATEGSSAIEDRIGELNSELGTSTS